MTYYLDGKCLERIKELPGMRRISECEGDCLDERASRLLRDSDKFLFDGMDLTLYKASKDVEIMGDLYRGPFYFVVIQDSGAKRIIVLVEKGIEPIRRDL